MKYDPNAKRDYNPIPAGHYTLVIKDIDADRTSDAGNKYCSISFVVFGGDYDGRYVFDVFMYDDRFCWKWRELFLCAKVDHEQLAGESIAPFSVEAKISEMLRGKSVKVIVGHETNKKTGKPDAKIKNYVFEEQEEETKGDEKKETKKGKSKNKGKGKDDDGFN